MQLRLDLVLQSKLLLTTSLGSVARPRASCVATLRVSGMATARASFMAATMATAMATAMTEMGDMNAVETMSGVLIELRTLRHALSDVHSLFFKETYSSCC